MTIWIIYPEFARKKNFLDWGDNIYVILFSFFGPAESKSGIHFIRPNPDTSDIFYRFSRFSGFGQRKYTSYFYFYRSIIPFWRRNLCLVRRDWLNVFSMVLWHHRLKSFFYSSSHFSQVIFLWNYIKKIHSSMNYFYLKVIRNICYPNQFVIIMFIVWFHLWWTKVHIIWPMSLCILCNFFSLDIPNI